MLPGETSLLTQQRTPDAEEMEGHYGAQVALCYQCKRCMAGCPLRVTQPLTGLKVVCYYGCLLTRPPAVAGAAHHEYPVVMDNLMAALGAEPLDWSCKTQCCGASFALTRPDLVTRLTGKILENAREVGAEAVVAACPLCQTNLDMHQGEHGANGSQESTLPVLYFTQLMGVAFGLSPRALGLDKHFRDPAPALRSHSLVT